MCRLQTLPGTPSPTVAGSTSSDPAKAKRSSCSANRATPKPCISPVCCMYAATFQTAPESRANGRDCFDLPGVAVEPEGKSGSVVRRERIQSQPSGCWSSPGYEARMIEPDVEVLDGDAAAFPGWRKAGLLTGSRTGPTERRQQRSDRFCSHLPSITLPANGQTCSRRINKPLLISSSSASARL